MVLGCITQLNANYDTQMSHDDDSNHTMGKIVAPAIVPVTGAMDIVTIDSQHFTRRFINRISGKSDNDSDNNMTEKQKPMKKKCSSNSMKSEKCKAPKKCKTACKKQNDDSDVADRNMYREVLENPVCEKTGHKNCHRQHDCHNHTGHKAGMHKDDMKNS